MLLDTYELLFVNVLESGTSGKLHTDVPLQMSLGLAEAVVTALVTANNYSVTVEYNGNSNSVNASEVADVFLAGLQDAVTPCAMNVSSTTNATSGSDAYFEDIATVRFQVQLLSGTVSLFPIHMAFACCRLLIAAIATSSFCFKLDPRQELQRGPKQLSLTKGPMACCKRC